MIPLARFTNELRRMKSAKHNEISLERERERERASASERCLLGPLGVVHVRTRTCGRADGLSREGGCVCKENWPRVRPWRPSWGGGGGGTACQQCRTPKGAVHSCPQPSSSARAGASAACLKSLGSSGCGCGVPLAPNLEPRTVPFPAPTWEWLCITA